MWEGRLYATPEASFVAALAARNAEELPAVIGAIANAIGRHGSHDQNKAPLELGGSAASVVTLLRSWAETLIANPDGRRGPLWDVTIAIGRLARPNFSTP